MNKVEWQNANKPPSYKSQYFVAVKYPNGLGIYDLLQWDGSKWLIGYTGEVVGWVTMTDFMASIKAGWPDWDNCDLAKSKGTDSTEEFIEIT